MLLLLALIVIARGSLGLRLSALAVSVPAKLLQSDSRPPADARALSASVWKLQLNLVVVSSVRSECPDEAFAADWRVIPSSDYDYDYDHDQDQDLDSNHGQTVAANVMLWKWGWAQTVA